MITKQLEIVKIIYLFNFSNNYAKSQGNRTKIIKHPSVFATDTDQSHKMFWFFVTFGAVHVLKLVSLLQSKVMLALLNICLLIALVLLTVPSNTPLFR